MEDLTKTINITEEIILRYEEMKSTLSEINLEFDKQDEIIKKFLENT